MYIPRIIIVVCITIAFSGAIVMILPSEILINVIGLLALWKFIDFIDDFVASCMGLDGEPVKEPSDLMKEYMSIDTDTPYEKWLELEIYKLREVERKWEVHQ